MYSRFGGFLLPRGCAAHAATDGLSTGCNAVSPRQYVLRANHISVVLVQALHATEPRLRESVRSTDTATYRTLLAGVLRRHCNESATGPLELVLQLAAELKPALVEDGLVQTGLGPNAVARILSSSRSRPGHILYPQVLNAYHRVVLADGARGLVQVVASGVADTGMDSLDASLGLLPVVAELHLVAQRPLCAAQTGLVPLEAVEGREEAAVTEGGEASNAYIDTHGAGGL